jgi:hypothetical protein
MFFNETELVMLIVALAFVVLGGIGIAVVLDKRAARHFENERRFDDEDAV